MHYIELNINIDPFRDLPEHYYDPGIHAKLKSKVWNKFINANDINKETHEWFNNYGLEITHPMLFAYHGNSRSRVHLDGYKTDSQDLRLFSAINFSKGSDGLINWYSVINPENLRHGEDALLSKTPYQPYHDDDVTLVESYNYKKPVLVDVSIPHNGENISDGTRYTITLRWSPITTFDDAIRLFKNHI
jgi:hypothetical protein